MKTKTMVTAAMMTAASVVATPTDANAGIKDLFAKLTGKVENKSRKMEAKKRTRNAAKGTQASSRDSVTGNKAKRAKESKAKTQNLPVGQVPTQKVSKDSEVLPIPAAPASQKQVKIKDAKDGNKKRKKKIKLFDKKRKRFGGKLRPTFTAEALNKANNELAMAKVASGNAADFMVYARQNQKQA